MVQSNGSGEEKKVSENSFTVFFSAHPSVRLRARCITESFSVIFLPSTKELYCVCVEKSSLHSEMRRVNTVASGREMLLCTLYFFI